jgi:hypothetical protein
MEKQRFFLSGAAFFRSLTSKNEKRIPTLFRPIFAALAFFICLSTGVNRIGSKLRCRRHPRFQQQFMSAVTRRQRTQTIDWNC